MEMTNNDEKFVLVKYAPGKYDGVAETARGIGVGRHAIYMYLRGYVGAISEKKRNRIVLIDYTSMK